MQPELNRTKEWAAVGGLSGASVGMANQAPRPVLREEEAEKTLAASREHRELARQQALQLQMVMPAFSANLNQLQSGITQWMQHQGFWASDNKGEKLALIHSEVSETLEAVRKGDGANEVEELADIVIRVLDYAGYHGFDLGAAIHQKMLANYNRPYRHGKAF